MAERYDVSERTIRRILSKNLQSDLLKKTETHALSNKQVQQRLNRGPRFLKLLEGDRWKYVVSFDEFCLSMNDCGGIRDCYYRKKGKPVPESRTKKWKQKFPKKVMCAAGVSYRGATSIYFVSPTSKVDSAFFLNNIVKPIVEKGIPRPYPGKEHKVILHFDIASSHTTPAVYSYPKSKKVKKAIQAVLSSELGRNVSQNSIRMLPIEEIRIDSKVRLDEYHIANEWTSYANQPSTFTFRITCFTNETCIEVAENIRQHPEAFASGLEVFYSLQTLQTKKRSVLVKLWHMRSAESFAKLQLEFPDEDHAYLLVADWKKIEREVSTTILTTEMTDEDFFVSSDEAANIARHLDRVLSVKNMGSDSFTHDMWSRVFWTAESARPDVTAKDLTGEKRSKRKTHMLSDKQVAQRVLKIPRLFQHLNGGKRQYIVSIDEAWCYMSNVNGRRKIYYRFWGKESPQSWLKYCKQKHPREVMFFAGISAHEITAIRFVSPRTKTNSDFYVDRVLKSIFKKDILRLYGKDARSVALHHDSAPSHMALDTVRFFQNSKYRYVPKEDWPSNSPNLSPMDYSINSIFKRKMWKHKSKNFAGLIRAKKREWSDISVDLYVRTL
ncbi:hypothetical protein BV898_06547 [Hypsibius exemplaris]|uniref:Mariner Mos1 transposase n=1 Tax=Hypsibius exemplaris TaxID=2072580 RepID=A0A1W0WW82_HYPEX|nr:hypothetical protein BV898_06547 [Hypsibius exemplaris]